MASFEWIALLFALIGHTVFATAFSSESGVPAIDFTLPLDVSPVVSPLDVSVADTQSSNPLTIETRDDHLPNPGDFRWIRRWAALGDSFTAGIGAGNLLTRDKNEDWRCSRYDRSYPIRLEQAFGPGPEFFQYLACSGDRTEQIYGQVQKMEGDMDFVIMTAGGNDLCLSDIIKICVLLPLQAEDDCSNAIAIAEDNLRHKLKSNVKQVLEELDKKMHKNGLLLYVLYAHFFNTDTEKCSRFPDWNITPIGSALPLTRERRQKFNELVDKTNAALRDVIEEVTQFKKIKYRIRTVDWNDWAKFGVHGQFCFVGSTGQYPDPAQPDLQFFKPVTIPAKDLKRVKRQELGLGVRDIPFEGTLVYTSPNPAAVAKHLLNSRAPLPPGCPSDNGWFQKFLGKLESWGIGLPDGYGRFFHPNELGHTTIASYVLQEIFNARAEDLGTFNPTCALYDRFECHKTPGDSYDRYAAVDRVVTAMNRFCVNGHQKWIDSDSTFAFHDQTFYERTPDQTRFEVQINRTTGTHAFDPDQCKDSFNRIIHGCDGNDPENPLNFKFGGRWVRGPYTYRLSMGGPEISRDKELPKKVKGQCTWKKTSKGIEYEVYGSAFANWDFGRWTLLAEATKCAGGNEKLVHWSWLYYPFTVGGWDWYAKYVVPSDSEKNCHLVPSNTAGEQIVCKKKK